MALSAETQASLREVLDAIDEFYERRLGEIDRDVRNLREYGSPIGELGDQTTEAAADQALDIIEAILSS